MKHVDKLLIEVTELNKKMEFNRVIELISNEVLDKYKNSDLYAESAVAFWHTKKYNDSEKSAKKALELDHKNAKAFNCLGNIASNIKEYEKAKEYYLNAIEINPKDSMPYTNLGILFEEINDYKNAEEYYLRAILIDKNDIVPYNCLGILYSKLSEYEKSIEYYLKAIKLEPKNSVLHNNVGNEYYVLENYEYAIKHYLEAIKFDSNYSEPYNGLGNLYFDMKEYANAKKYFIQYLALNKNTEDYFHQLAISHVKEIDTILENITYKKVTILVDKIKDLLKFNGEFVTHYTSISTAQFLVLKESPLRLSEGSFLNDTSEGRELFSYLDYLSGENTNKKNNKESFTRRPFIGSFVDAEKNNDLTLWRMYGKELLEEAKGCSITLNAINLVSKIKNTICPGKEFTPSNFDDIEFYRVAYRDGGKFEFAGASYEQNSELSHLMKNLLKIIKVFKNQPIKNKYQEIEVVELLNQIAYLFKSTEYKYENEIRLIIKDAIGFERKIDFDIHNFKPSTSPLKVYIELVPIHNLLSKITIGPKVDKAEEWAATFYYQLANQEFPPEIEISTLPFK